MSGLQFLHWDEEGTDLTLLAKDHEAVMSLHSSYIVDGKRLGMVTSDFEGNLQVLQYKPK